MTAPSGQSSQTSKRWASICLLLGLASPVFAQLTAEELRRASQAGLVEEGFYESGGQRVENLPELAPEAYPQQETNTYVPQARARREARERAAREAEQSRIRTETAQIAQRMREAQERYQADINQLSAQYQRQRSELEAATAKLERAKQGLEDYNKTRSWLSNTFVVSSEERWRKADIAAAEAEVTAARRAASTTGTALNTTMRNAEGLARSLQVQAVKVDPNRVQAVNAQRVRELEDTYDQLQTQKAQIRAGESGFAERNRQLDTSIQNAQNANNDALVEKLETEKQQLAETHTMWRNGMRTELDGYKQDLQRSYERNRQDGLGPTSTMGLEFGLRQAARAEGKDPDVTVGQIDQAAVDRTRASAEQVAQGAGNNSVHVNIFDNPASWEAWGDFTTDTVVINATDYANATDVVGNAQDIYHAATTGDLKPLKDRHQGLLRIYNYGAGVTEGSVTALVDLGVLIKDTSVASSQAVDHSLSFWLGTKPIFEDPAELRKAQQFAGLADTLIFDPYGQGGEAATQIVDGLSTAIGRAGRDFERMAGRGREGELQGVRLVGNITGQVVDPLTEGLFLLKPLDAVFDTFGIVGDASKFADDLPPPGVTHYGDTLSDLGGPLRLDGPGPREVNMPIGGANDATQFFPPPGATPNAAGVNDATQIFPPGTGGGGIPGPNDPTQMFPSPGSAPDGFPGAVDGTVMLPAGPAGSPGGFGLLDEGTQMLPAGNGGGLFGSPSASAPSVQPWDEFGSNPTRIAGDSAPAQVVSDAEGNLQRITTADGQQIALDQKLGAGSTSVAYRGADGQVVKITAPGEGALDDYGYEVIKNIDPDGAAIQVPTIHSRQRLQADSPDARVELGGGSVAAEGASVRVMDQAPADFRSARKQGDTNSRAPMTEAEKAAYDRGMEALNRNGYVFLDDKPDNYAFVKNDSGDLVMMIVDPGGIIPIRGRNADIARNMQMDMNNPQKLFDELKAAGKLEGTNVGDNLDFSKLSGQGAQVQIQELMQIKYGDAPDYAELNRRLGKTGDAEIRSLNGSDGAEINYFPRNFVEAPNAGAPRGDVDLPDGVRDPAKPETIDPATGDPLPGGPEAVAKRNRAIEALSALRNSDYYPWLSLFWDHRTLQLMAQINKQLGPEGVIDFAEQAGSLFESGAPVPPGVGTEVTPGFDRPVTGSSRPVTGVSLPDPEGEGGDGGLLLVGGGSPISTVPPPVFVLTPTNQPPPFDPDDPFISLSDDTTYQLISVLPIDQNNPFDRRDPLNPDGSNGDNFIIPPNDGPIIVTPPVTPPGEDPPATVPISAISIGGGDFVLVRDLTVSPPDACPGDHYHAFSPVISCQGVLTFDPNPTECGFGQQNLSETTIDLLSQCPSAASSAGGP